MDTVQDKMAYLGGVPPEERLTRLAGYGPKVTAESTVATDHADFGACPHVLVGAPPGPHAVLAVG